MNKHFDKILAVLVIGSIWGALEIYGVRIMQAMAIPHRSPFLFAGALLLMMASKRLPNFLGSAVIIALIAGLYKTFTFNLPACGSNAFVAIIIDGAVFEIGYQMAKTSIEASLWKRSAAGPTFAISAFLLFGLYATYISPENAASGGNFNGLFNLLKSNGILAAILSIITINIGLSLGNSLRNMSANQLSPKTTNISRAVGILTFVAAWTARVVSNV
jgi:hypothetical protein